MKERTNIKLYFFIITLTITFFISTWKHLIDSTNADHTWNTNVFVPKSTLHTIFGRTLNSDTEEETQQKYQALKERIINLLGEDDDNFRERFNALMHDGVFRKEYNVLMSECNLEKLSTALKRYEDFEKRVNPFKNNKRFKKSRKNLNNNHHLNGRYDEFKYYNDDYEGRNRAFYYVNDFKVRQKARRPRYSQVLRKEYRVKKNEPRIFTYLNRYISSIKAKMPRPYITPYNNNKHVFRRSIKYRKFKYCMDNFKAILTIYSVKLLKLILYILYYTSQEIFDILFP
ncbi:Plasmodium exported protein, unknown function [Plasmodium gonderi]|uniref:Uncharacterized protein n=1 Tax=Plasmodium gonderi TaxID=77519 RepID=A0A1Y1JE45_PLAGO|nr:Plasmodium exported protein, unknown function [Plasmodium gonderi]GAW80799.1 Plasmodium exported protein, unknown function [Plasmodium gonderi]